MFVLLRGTVVSFQYFMVSPNLKVTYIISKVRVSGFFTILSRYRYDTILKYCLMKKKIFFL